MLNLGLKYFYQKPQVSLSLPVSVETFCFDFTPISAIIFSASQDVSVAGQNEGDVGSRSEGNGDDKRLCEEGSVVVEGKP